MESVMNTKHLSSENNDDIHDITGASKDMVRRDAIVPSIPALKGKYEYIQQIGSGAQGDIYKARHLKDGKLVAIKQLRIDQIENWKAYDLFDREANVLAKLNIDGVAKFYEAGKCFDANPPYAYIVQELIDGISLESHMHSGRRWTLAQTFDIAIQILDILEKLHHADPPIIHRDLKPGNIMICQNALKDKVYLIDFGAVANPLVQGGGSTIAGTFGFMPPEQLMGKPGPESDLYALAATVVYMLSGVSPADMQTLEFRLVIEPHLQSYPPAVMHLLGRMLEPTANKRLTDYKEIRQQFYNFSQSIFIEQLNDTDDFYTSSEYIPQFKSVKTLWDNGNLKLWSALPSQTPRNIPDGIMLIESQDLKSHHSIAGKHLVTKDDAGGCVKVFATFTLIPMIFGCLFGAYLSISEDGITIYELLKILLFAPFVVLPLGLILWLVYGSPKFKSYAMLPAREFTSTNTYFERNKLLLSGQKTIATVVSVHYQPNSGDYTEQCNYRNSPYNGLYIHDNPCYIITYKFNPPNDSLADDLFHHIIVHREPGKHLQPGDPLPILYRIDPLDNRKVYSMPYPFASCDVENYREIICCSENGVIMNQEFTPE